jgi:hypothetical protein
MLAAAVLVLLGQAAPPPGAGEAEPRPAVGAPAPSADAAAAESRSGAREDVWAPVRFLIGDWTGEANGQPGRGTSKRSYRFVLKGRFIHEQNVSTYPPQPANPSGEVHEHQSYLSFDRARLRLVLRQFHQEGFVNQYAALAPAGGSLVFESEAIENVPEGWRARETYTVLTPDEFLETFEVAPAGGQFAVYSQTRLKRVVPR